MKKKYWILIIIILLICVSILLLYKKEAKFYLNDKYYGSSSLVEIDNDKLKELEKNKESFVVFVKLSGCITCSAFEPVLQKFINTYQISFYSIPFDSIKDTCIEECVKYSPSVVIFKEGKTVAYLDSNKKEDLSYFKSMTGFKEWLTKYVVLKEYK